MAETPTPTDAEIALVAGPLVDLLEFWFGDLVDSVAPASDDIRLRRWWSHDAALDREIADRFGATVERVADLARRGWRPADVAQATAAVVALDQLPRNIHRGGAAMYAHDDLAVTMSRHAAALVDPLAGDLYRASFVHMPLMHSERLADQDEMVIRFDAIAAEAERRASPNLAYFRNALDFAHRHRDIVARFGRFPHRNVLLGRISTPDEEAFLKEDGSSF